MKQETYTLSRPVSLSLPVEEIDRLLSEKSGDCALVYLALQRAGGKSVEPRALGLTEAAYADAMRTLERLGVVTSGERRSAPLPPSDELPEYTSDDLILRIREDQTFAGVYQYAEQLFGRKLSTPELRLLLGMQDHLGLPPDVLMELLTYVFDRYRAQHGPGRTPTMRMVEKEAYAWARNEVMTSAMAQEYITRQQQRQSRLAELLDALQIRGRAPTPSERKYLTAWLDMGFGPDAVAEAYDRTVIGAGGLKWAYLNKILVSWDSRKLHRLPDILAQDPRGGARKSAAPAAEITPQRNDLALAEKLLRKRKQEG